MNNSIINRCFIVFISILLGLGFTSCKDKDTLGSASETYATIFPAAPNLNLVYGVDTIEMKCDVMNHYGKTFDEKVVWSSSDESVVKFLDGTNKLVAVEGAQGKNAIVRATLSNGKYVETTANVVKLKATGINIFKQEGDALTTMLETEYINLGSPMQILLVPNPSDISYQNEFEFENDAFTVRKMDLDPVTDEKKIEITPKGGVWYLISCNKKGDHTLKMSIGEKPQKQGDLSTFFEVSQKFIVGSVVAKMGLNDKMDEAEGTGVLDINKKDTVTFFLDISPAELSEVTKIFEGAQWSIEGSGAAIVLDKKFEIEPSRVKFMVFIESGSQEGTLSVGCTVQNKTARKTITVADFANKPFEGISIDPPVLDEELYVGETRGIRIKVEPMSSYPYIAKSFKMSFSVPDVVELSENSGAYTIKGLKQGETELIVSTRGKEARLRIVTKAAVKSVLIDNTTPNIIMEGDIVEWFANVVMEGQDKPDFDRLLWSITDPKTKPSVTISKPAKGKKITVTARQLPAGESLAETTIKAEYRGKSNERKITVVPLQKSQTIEQSDLGTDDDAYIEYRSGSIEIALGLNNNAKEAGKSLVTYIITPKNPSADIQGTYNVDNSDIYIKWNDFIGLTKVVKTANIVLNKVNDEYYSVSATTSSMVGDKNIDINANISKIRKY